MKMEPRAVTETDEKQLEDMMAKYQRAQNSGDEEEGDEEEVTGMGGGDL